ncbi:MAG: NAD(P)/FAD-dependent oxidoreductase [Prevotellaceae bacterium]|nr:NAD(P)/FAD-dependent oxidoreductase [Prevotellaceae bacterium]
MNKLIIIGAGPGGYETAIEAAKRDIQVTLITDDELGGTCLNEGCIPTKTFVNSSSLDEAQQRKHTVIDQLKAGIAMLMKHKNITLVNGHASFLDNHTITVGDQQLTADNIIIATGSQSAMLPIPNADKCITSKEILNLSELPQSLCIIGGGVIGLEFASIFNSFGTQVTVLEYCKQILPPFDTDLAKRLKQILSKSGINIVTSAQVTGVQPISSQCQSQCQSQQLAVSGMQVDYLLNDKPAQTQTQLCLMAVGRRPAVDSLGLENTTIKYSPKGIVVNDNMQTSVPGVYAIGDVNAKMMLAHVAIFQGKRALNHILGVTDRIRFNIVPSAVFTTPEVAMVGMTEEACKAQDINYKTYKSFFRANGKAVSMNESEGYCKLIVSNDTQHILGCHIIGAHSSDMIHEIAALMNMDATLTNLQNIIHAHPTLSEVILSAANA